MSPQLPQSPESMSEDSVPSLIGQHSTERHWTEDEFGSDYGAGDGPSDSEFGEDDGSWLMSLDDDTGDRPGFDPIAHEDVDDYLGAEVLQASWHEKPRRTSVLQRLLVPAAALAVIGLVGAAGWRMLDMRSQGGGTVPEALPATFDLGAGRVIRPEIDSSTASRRREVVGQNANRSRLVDPDSPNAGRPNAIVRDDVARAGFAWSDPNSSRPNYALANPNADRPNFPAPNGDRGPRVAAGTDTTPPRSEPLDREPEDLSTPPGGATELELEPATHVAVNDPSRDLPTPAPEVQRRWRSLFGLESHSPESSGRLLDPPLPVPPLSGGAVVAEGPSFVRPRAEGETGEETFPLPYGLDAAFIPGWRPELPAAGAESEADARGLTVVRAATWSDMTHIWQGKDVPLGAIDREQRMHTPAVGFVALTLTTGDVLDGRLHSVGQGRIWIQNDLGLTAIEHDRLGQIVQIPEEDAASGLNVVESLERVRVRSAGGVLFGHVLTKDGLRTTVVTDGGSRITVSNDQVDYVGSEADVLLRRG